MQKKDIREFHNHPYPFDKTLSEIQTRVLRLFDREELRFQKNFTSLPKEGIIVKHDGLTSRQGWIGVVVHMDLPKDPDNIGVRWLLDEDGNKIRNKKDKNDVGLYQSYSVGWCNSSMQVGRIKCYSLDALFGKVEPEQDKGGEKVVNDNHNGKFIVWGQKGKTNPVNVTGYKEAIAAAEAMTIRHRETFHVAKLVTKVSPITEIIPKVEAL